jgi:hypothetical protein
LACLFRYPLSQRHDYSTIHPCCRWLSITVYTSTAPSGNLSSVRDDFTVLFAQTGLLPSLHRSRTTQRGSVLTTVASASTCQHLLSKRPTLHGSGTTARAFVTRLIFQYGTGSVADASTANPPNFKSTTSQNRHPAPLRTPNWSTTLSRIERRCQSHRRRGRMSTVLRGHALRRLI